MKTAKAASEPRVAEPLIDQYVVAIPEENKGKRNRHERRTQRLKRLGPIVMDPLRVGGGGGSGVARRRDRYLSCLAHAMLTGMPKATAVARTATMAQPTPALLVVATNTPTTRRAMPLIATCTRARSERDRGRASFADLGARFREINKPKPRSLSVGPGRRALPARLPIHPELRTKVWSGDQSVERGVRPARGRRCRSPTQ